MVHGLETLKRLNEEAASKPILKKLSNPVRGRAFLEYQRYAEEVTTVMGGASYFKVTPHQKIMGTINKQKPIGVSDDDWQAYIEGTRRDMVLQPIIGHQSTKSIAKELNLDVQAGERARALHRIVRAMHDGHCPKCGYLAPSEEFYEPSRSRIDPPLVKEGKHQCPMCHFTVTDEEAKDALAEFKPFLTKSVELFEQWRKDRKESEQVSKFYVREICGIKPQSEPNTNVPMHELKSWDRSELTARQRLRYTTEPVGESFNSGRTTFRVRCTVCGKTLHDCTNGPNYYIEEHDRICPPKV